MSHLIVEIPKEMPLEGFWVFIAAENWIKDDILSIPDNSYSHAYKQSLLVKSAEPQDTWEKYPCFKIIKRFGSYDEARKNLPRAEKGLPMCSDSSKFGRGCRDITAKNHRYPGEPSTTEQEDEEDASITSKSQSIPKKKNASSASKRPTVQTTYNSRKATIPATKFLPTPPSALQGNKENEVALRKSFSAATDSEDDCTGSFEVNSQEITDQLDFVEGQQDSFGTLQNSFESQPLRQSLNSPSVLDSLNSPPVLHSLNSPPLRQSSDSQRKRMPLQNATVTNRGSESKGSGPKKFKLLETLAAMNEKLSVLEKSATKPIEENISSNDDEEVESTFPLVTVDQFEKLERDLKEKTLFNKLVKMITKLGNKPTAKHPRGDYIRRAWASVLSASVAKELNWNGRRDKRVNGGNGKRGIKECLITKAIKRGIQKNKEVGLIEDMVFLKETVEFLRNAASAFNRKQEKLAIEDNEDTSDSE